MKIRVNFADLLNNFIISLDKNRDSWRGLSRFSIKTPSKRTISILFPTLQDISRLYNPAHFASNFYAVFGSRFDENSFELGPGRPLEIVINKEIASLERAATIKDDEKDVFALLLCLFFGYRYNIYFRECKCYPRSVEDLVLYSTALGMNCVNNCDLNVLFQTDCPQKSILNTAVIISGGIVNLEITINQTIVVITSSQFFNSNNAESPLRSTNTYDLDKKFTFFVSKCSFFKLNERYCFYLEDNKLVCCIDKKNPTTVVDNFYQEDFNFTLSGKNICFDDSYIFSFRDDLTSLFVENTTFVNGNSVYGHDLITKTGTAIYFDDAIHFDQYLPVLPFPFSIYFYQNSKLIDDRGKELIFDKNNQLVVHNLEKWSVFNDKGTTFLDWPLRNLLYSDNEILLKKYSDFE